MSQTIVRNTHTIDAEGQAVGRVASAVAHILRGKHKPDFTPHIDAGDIVVVMNASKVIFTGRKYVQKDYRHHSMHPGGLKTRSMKNVFEEDPTEVLRKAVYGMIPKNRHRDELMKRLTINA